MKNYILYHNSVTLMNSFKIDEILLPFLDVDDNDGLE